MRVIGRKILLKLKKKQIGNQKLGIEIDRLLNDLESFNPSNGSIKTYRADADCVHPDGFYFFNLNIHRTLILIELEDEGDATIIWAGNHKEYDSTFKNNKNAIENWLKKFGYI
ncbi:type II toxin-antitoxin system HigB family toxin [Aquirufa sp. ROCK-SH2]|uniref:Type II toxin-antitoxin system HigB family toxin n=1 Tax=Sandaracinomonas limnophila TaxID=1862386 RepID=A0A437PPQ0_9BACT|nr:type II toxin-antitoxin system HigB family toxin [Sandaracinomonas limnophila]RVU24252.1 type II toxin-antitoxin system HigB family toxin [Sandaracinomonas limnophila]